MNGKPIVIAIIDSGIDTTKSSLSSYVIKTTGYKINNEGYIVQDVNKPVENIHGTAIAMIIKQLYENVTFININILNDKLTTDMRVLLVALEKVLLLKPNIIHLSLATKRFNYRFALGKIIKQAMKDNITIVAATNNDGTISYPAYHKDVIGVKGIHTDDIYTFNYNKNFFLAPLGTKNIIGMEELESYQECVGTSMSAAYITGHIAKIMDKYHVMGTSEVVKYLKLEALKKQK